MLDFELRELWGMVCAVSGVYPGGGNEGLIFGDGLWESKINLTTQL